MERTRLPVLAATVLLPAGLLLGAAAPAQAAVVDLSCAGTVAAHYAPPLQPIPRPTAITSSAQVGCAISSDPTLTSGTFGGSSTATASCLTGSASGTLTFTWNNGRTSTAQITSVAALRPNGDVVTVSTGTVVDGEFEGDKVVTEVTLLADDQLACLLGAGVSSVSGPTTVTFTAPLTR
ncbi:hypothetical protein [Streptomyces acidiscabies]|uniref:Ig-like domain-containing protein n=1 Tax=Streptomyces acidiscabies TaxID=42234 RepID=A0AAP6EIF7_9ACTN|nr:hypothetical protein [Streptomyces acidiscabies]MBP5942093.1 hypothetical protein [Streptomyces sp. LBUM 1476]MBZ3913587.1 hypothetical protein [Streptomyces acidiscabies]MDX2963425.1 hypothetical protein [Streptomyces acidiscabies]MDX3023159.1 hypothetical protein [Streptomyces acidiscabies]MDX3792697.1 hypothetical protein [Streptomyces acidiscabies]